MHELTHIKRARSAHAGNRAAGVRDLLVQSARLVRRRRPRARARARVRRRSVAVWREAVGLRDAAARSRAQARIAVDSRNRAQHGAAVGDRRPAALDSRRCRPRAPAIDAVAGWLRHRHDHDGDPRRAGGDASEAAAAAAVARRSRGRCAAADGDGARQRRPGRIGDGALVQALGDSDRAGARAGGDGPGDHAGRRRDRSAARAR